MRFLRVLADLVAPICLLLGLATEIDLIPSIDTPFLIRLFLRKCFVCCCLIVVTFGFRGVFAEESLLSLDENAGGFEPFLLSPLQHFLQLGQQLLTSFLHSQVNLFLDIQTPHTRTLE